MARRNALAAGTLVGALVLVALHLWRGIEYWNYSEGVYAYDEHEKGAAQATLCERADRSHHRPRPRAGHADPRRSQ